MCEALIIDNKLEQRWGRFRAQVLSCRAKLLLNIRVSNENKGRRNELWEENMPDGDFRK